MLTLSFRKLADSIAHCLWSREPYRHLQVEITVSKDGDAAPFITFEVLVPETAIFNLSGDRWNPACRYHVNGTVYDAWQTLGGYGRFAGGSEGVSFPRVGHGEFKERLTVNLKPYLTSVELLWRLFQQGEPVSDYSKVSFDLQRYVPSPIR